MRSFSFHWERKALNTHENQPNRNESNCTEHLLLKGTAWFLLTQIVIECKNWGIDYTPLAVTASLACLRFRYPQRSSTLQSFPARGRSSAQTCVFLNMLGCPPLQLHCRKKSLPSVLQSAVSIQEVYGRERVKRRDRQQKKWKRNCTGFETTLGNLLFQEQRISFSMSS